MKARLIYKGLVDGKFHFVEMELACRDDAKKIMFDLMQNKTEQKTFIKPYLTTGEKVIDAYDWFYSNADQEDIEFDRHEMFELVGLDLYIE